MDTLLATIGRITTYQTEGNSGYKVWLAPEGLRTSDDRFIQEGALSWRKGRLPLTFSDNEGSHDDAVHVGNLFDFQKEEDDQGVVWVTASAEFDSDDEAQEAKRLVDEDKLRGVSVHFADFEADLECADEENYDGCILNVTMGVIAAATIVIIPAFEDAHIEPIAASATPVDLFTPPRDWFEDPQLPETTFTTVTEDGRIFGHLTPDQSACHLGFTDCVPPPYGNVDYEEFNSHARVTCADGANIPVGVLTFDGPHAPIDRYLSIESRMRRYDDTTSVAAYVRAGEDEHGTWIAGAIAPDLDKGDVEKVRRLSLSGDWLPRGGRQVLAAAHAIPVPGFAIKAKVASAGGAMLTVGPRPPEPVKPDLVLVAAAIQSLRETIGELRADLTPVVEDYTAREREARLQEALAVFGDTG